MKRVKFVKELVNFFLEQKQPHGDYLIIKIYRLMMNYLW